MSSNGRAAQFSHGGSRYTVLRSLASGGMAHVELALQVSSGGFERLVVVKRIRPELAGSAQVVAMFKEEARIAALLNHPNLIHAYELCQDENGLFLSMEHLRGQPLSNVLELGGTSTLDLRVALEVLTETLEGLQHAHQLTGIDGEPMRLVHRDISPSNVFVTYSGHVKLLDFGIAKAQHSVIETEAGFVKGKVAYMAPEQALDQELDGRADIYAVGTILWEAIANRSRWGEAPDAAILRALTLPNPPPPPGAAARRLPPFFDAVTQRALAFDPAQRFQTAAEFREALVALAEQLGPRLTPREMAAYVGERFEQQRSQEQRTIENQLAALKAEGTPSEAGPQTRALGPPSTPPVRGDAAVASLVDKGRDAPREIEFPYGALASQSDTVAPRLRLWRIVLPAAVLLGAGLSWLFFFPRFAGYVSGSDRDPARPAGGSLSLPSKAIADVATVPAPTAAVPTSAVPTEATPTDAGTAAPALVMSVDVPPLKSNRAPPLKGRSEARPRPRPKPAAAAKAKPGLELDRGSPF